LVRFSYLQKRNRLKRYGFVLVSALLVIPLANFLPDSHFLLINSQTISFLGFILVVTVSAWYGGLGPGILATILVSLINYFTILRMDYPAHPLVGDLLIVFVYMLVGFLISLISEARYEADFQKDQFIALAAHEIKNPLSTIKGYVNLLQGKIKKCDKKKFFEYVEEIDIQTNRSFELITDLLDVTKIEIGKFTYKEEPFDFDSLVEKIVSSQQMINRHRVITLSGSTRKIVNADRYRLGQVVTNLLTNAVKYSPQKSPVKVRIKSKRGGVSLIVKDYGIGIPRSEQKAIFKNFYRVQRARQLRRSGLGIGLYIASQIVKYHHGRLGVKSHTGKGTVFSLEIPENF